MQGQLPTNLMRWPGLSCKVVKPPVFCAPESACAAYDHTISDGYSDQGLRGGQQGPRISHFDDPELQFFDDDSLD